MKVAIQWALVFAMLLALPGGSVSATSGPHGAATMSGESCERCHRSHQSGEGQMGVQEVGDLCLSCHGTSATGAHTNVEDGVFAPSGAYLLGGGFVTYRGQPTTSAHNIDGSPQMVWGATVPWNASWDCEGCHNTESDLIWPPDSPQAGTRAGFLPDPEQAEGEVKRLACTTCHLPHGGSNYRMLRDRPSAFLSEEVRVVSNETGGLTPDEPGYVPDYVTARYRQGLGDWCVGCHTHYQLEAPFEVALQGNPNVSVQHRHRISFGLGGTTSLLPQEQPDGFSAAQQETDRVFCLTCHYAHGTSVEATGFASSVPPTHDSALLRLDNRGVCQDCHKK